MSKLVSFAEKGYLPNTALRIGIKALVSRRLTNEKNNFSNNYQEKLDQFIKKLEDSPVAVHQEEANLQHYEVPSKFYQIVLGKHLKYSCCYWEEETKNLSEAEEKSLEIICERAQLNDNLEILDLGCGWGSFSLYAAKKFPNSNFTAVSNSKTQKKFIDHQAKEKGIKNLKVITSDVSSLELNSKFDRIVSIEMFEHMRNYKTLFNNVSNWLKDDGKAFVHVFCHQKFPYLFETNTWMGKHFFTGGTMPSFELFKNFDQNIKIEKSWEVNGTHYQKTSEAWLKNTELNKRKIIDIFSKDMSLNKANQMYHRWRLFFLACAELFGFKNGNEWLVAHYRFTKA